MSSEGRDLGTSTLSFIVQPFPLKRPISSECPSQVDLDALCRIQAPAVPAEFISGHDYQWQCLREEVVSLTDRQQNPGDRMAEGWSRFNRGGEKNGIKRHAGIIPRVLSAVTTVGEGKAEASACL